MEQILELIRLMLRTLATASGNWACRREPERLGITPYLTGLDGASRAQGRDSWRTVKRF